MKFMKCSHCGNIVAYVTDKGVPVVCCGEKMKEIVPNTTEAATEKHLPVVTVSDNKVEVKVGDVAHPMTEEHLINWIALETRLGNQRKELRPGSEPAVTFAMIDGDKPVAVYSFCNLHGLWKTEL